MEVSQKVVITWVAFIVQLVILSAFKNFIDEFDVAIILIIGFTSFVLIARIFRFRGCLRPIIFAGYLARLVALFLDVYGRGFFHLPHSGADSEGFLRSAELISSDLSLLTQSIYGGYYAKLLGLIFNFTVTERLLAQFINVLIGMSTIFIIYKILTRLRISVEALTIAVVVASLFPHSIIFSAILLRESITTMLVASSIFCSRMVSRRRFYKGSTGNYILIISKYFSCWCNRINSRLRVFIYVL